MTLDGCEMDLSKVFERGQGYVAISRLKELNRLKLIGFNDISLEVDSLAMKADKRFQQLSIAADIGTTPQQLETESGEFIKRCGGRKLRKLTSEEAAELKKKREDGKDTLEDNFELY